MEHELKEIAGFITQSHIEEHIPAMEVSLDLANGYQYRVGALLNEAIEDYELSFQKFLDDLGRLEDETETLRKAKLMGWTAPKKKLVNDLKNMKGSLKAISMSLLQAIKTRREER